MMRSMTGFGVGSAPLGGGRLVIEIKTVNHRFLEIRCRAPRELAAAEARSEKLVRSALNRGHCTVGLMFETSTGGVARLDGRALSSHLAELEAVAARTGVPLAALVPVLASAPDIYALPVFDEPEALALAVDSAFADAMAKVVSMRETEGRAMASDLTTRLSEIRAVVLRLEKLATGYAATILARTRLKVAALLEDNDLALETGRIESEVALLADKADISEEITRLASHCDQLSRLLGSSDPVGRRLDFLIQEMGREANTIGAKAAFAELTHAVVEFKADLEKMREIVQNVE
jgi:uncharacterized protein (TIGR00255 family)